jgi:hypothetical protein
MNQSIAHYKVIEESHLAQLEGRVNQDIAGGWHPVGNVQILGSVEPNGARLYAQSLVKYKTLDAGFLAMRQEGFRSRATET